MIPHRAAQTVINKEETHGSYQHCLQHQPGSGSPNKDTVQEKSREACQRNCQYPIKIALRGLDDTRLIGQQTKESLSA